MQIGAEDSREMWEGQRMGRSIYMGEWASGETI